MLTCYSNALLHSDIEKNMPTTLWFLKSSTNQ